MEEPTQAMVEEQIAHMESALMDVEEDARLWRNQISDENMRSALYDIEKAARELCHRVGRLAQPAGEQKMKTYKGTRAGPTAADEATVTVYPDDGQSYTLPWRLDLWNHSPTGLNWGYGGSGPAQCALAILADHLDDDGQAVKLHRRFKWAVIAGLAIDQPWELTSEQIDYALTRLAGE